MPGFCRHFRKDFAEIPADPRQHPVYPKRHHTRRGTEMLATSGLELIDWEASWAESGTAVAVGMIAAAVLALAVLMVMKKKAEAK